jgi:hypothetical protein
MHNNTNPHAMLAAKTAIALRIFRAAKPCRDLGVKTLQRLFASPRVAVKSRLDGESVRWHPSILAG